MSLGTTPLSKALTQLQKSLYYIDSDLARGDEELRRQFQAAAIPNFEITYEPAIKMLRRQLDDIVPTPKELKAPVSA